MAKSGRKARVVIGSLGVANTLSIAGLDKAWERHPDVASALAAAKPQAAGSAPQTLLGIGGNRL